MYELKNANKQITPTLYSVLRTVHTVSSLVFTLVPWEKVHSYLWNLKKMLGLEFARHQTPIILLFSLSNAQDNMRHPKVRGSRQLPWPWPGSLVQLPAKGVLAHAGS